MVLMRMRDEYAQQVRIAAIQSGYIREVFLSIFTSIQWQTEVE